MTVKITKPYNWSSRIRRMFGLPRPFRLELFVKVSCQKADQVAETFKELQAALADFQAGLSEIAKVARERLTEAPKDPGPGRAVLPPELADSEGCPVAKYAACVQAGHRVGECDRACLFGMAMRVNEEAARKP